jgi:hypothetical protein
MVNFQTTVPKITLAISPWSKYQRAREQSFEDVGCKPNIIDKS